VKAGFDGLDLVCILLIIGGLVGILRGR